MTILAQHSELLEELNSPSTDLGVTFNRLYHNRVHMKVVSEVAAVLACNNSTIPPEMIGSIVVAALLHDAGHTLDPDRPDHDNIRNALEYVDQYRNKYPEGADWRLVRALVKGTEQPLDREFIDAQPAAVREAMNVLNDADVLSALEPASQTNVVDGLRLESRFDGSVTQWVTKNNQFLREFVPASAEGKGYKARNWPEAEQRFIAAAQSRQGT